MTLTFSLGFKKLINEGKQSLDLGLPDISATKTTTPTIAPIGMKTTPEFLAEQAREISGVLPAARLTTKITGQKEFIPTTKLEKTLFGKEPIKPPQGKLATGLESLAVLPILPIGKLKPVVKPIENVVGNYLKSKVSTTLEKQPLNLGIVKDQFYNAFNKLYTATIDRFNPINKITKEAAKTGKILPGENPELLARRYLGVKGIAESKIFWKTTELTPEGNLKITGEGLSNILKPFKNNLDDLRALMVAERDLELAGRGITKGATPKESRQIIDILKTKPNYSQLQSTAQRVRDYANKAILDPLKEVGAISDETYNKIRQSNQFYTPFKRVMEEIETNGVVSAKANLFTPKGIPIKAIKGSEKAIIDPLESLISDTYKITDFVERERVAKAVVNLRKLSPELAEVIKEVKPQMIPVAREEMRAEIDVGFFNKLIGFAKNLGLKEFETKGRVGRTLGYYSPVAKKVVRKFASSRETASHEIGHFLDDIFSLRQRFYKGRIISKDVAEEIYQHSKIAGESLSRLKKPEERFANAFSWWLTHRDLAIKEMPLFNKEIKNIINENPKLKGLLDILPTPSPTIETKLQTIFRPALFTKEKNTIQVFENGARKFYQVEPELAKAMNGMSVGDMGVVLKLLSFPAKTLRVGATLTPEFIGRNPIRDQMSAFVFSKYGYIPGVDLVKGIWETIARKDVFQKWLASGGDQSMFVSLDRISNQKTLQETIKAVNPQRALEELKKFIKSPLDPLRALSAFGEKGTRIGAFKKAVGKVSDIEAAFESRDITLDFSRMGSQTKAVNQIIAFWNANIQGVDKLARAFKERPIQTSLKAIGGITLPSISLYLANRNNPRWQEIPQWQKDLFWIVMLPGEKAPIIRIPKPFELGIIFGTVPEHILAWIDKNNPEALKTIPEALSKGASPGMIPTALLPIIENTSNYSFFRDRPIVSQSLENLPPELQSNTYTAETAKEIGKIIKQSPAKIENFAYGYFGGLGRYAFDASDAILKSLNIVSPPPEPEKTLADQPFLKAFVVREPIGSGSESVNKFYDILEKSTRQYNAAKQIANKGEIDGSVKYLQEHKEALFYKGLNKVASSFSDIRKGKDKILNDKNLTPQQKRQAIDSLDSIMTEIARQILIVISESE